MQKKSKMQISNRKIGLNEPPFLIGEMSGNHGNDLKRALSLVDIAANSGCDAIKLQTFDLNNMTMDIDRPEFYVNDPNSPWNKEHLYNLYKKSQLPIEWHKEIFDRAKLRNIICFSSVFDLVSLESLENLDCPAYKIASAEIGFLDLIKEVSKTKKPILFSTGMASLYEIDLALNTILKENNSVENICIFKCTTDYPSDPKDANVKTIQNLRDIFGTEVGLSDHTKGIGAAVVSVGFGASVIEKHFVDKRDDNAVDGSFSMLPDELELLKRELNTAWESIGRIQYGPVKNEEVNIKYKRSLYFANNLNKGDKITENDLKSIRPNFGLNPNYKDFLIGKRLTKDIKKGDPAAFSDIS